MCFDFRSVVVFIFHCILFSPSSLPSYVGTSNSLNKLKAPGEGLLEDPGERKLHISKHINKESTELYTYEADISHGFIGVSKEKPVDNIFDNIFHVKLPNSATINGIAYLKYELRGVANHESVARSINNSQAIGAHLISLSKEWSEQKEVIPARLLRRGDNVIRFTLPEGADYNYEVRNVRIILEGEQIPLPAIIINSPSKVYYGNKTYIKGLVIGPSSSDYRTAPVYLICDNKPIAVHNGEFEIIIPNSKEKSFPTTLKATFSDGTVVSKDVFLKSGKEADLIYFHSLKGTKNIGRYNLTIGLDLELESDNALTRIQIPPHSLPYEDHISITALRDIDLATLGPDMINVTRGSAGYRFLPHGSKFSQEAELHIPYDSTLIPKGYTHHDIRTYFFDESKRKWIALPIDSIDESSSHIISKTTHFTDMINGIIQVPESPETRGYTPTFIKDFKPADPSAGITMMTPPTANNFGNASLTFDLKLPAGRQGMEPYLSFRYNNEGRNGWCGLGWDISVPSIEIDTRWGVPRYDPTLETETYLLAGEQLAPVSNRGEFKPRSSEKEFHPRVEQNFDRIIRHGSSPSNYWWEVTNKMGVRSFYGGLPELGLVDNGVLKDDNGNISKWMLVQIRDLDNNCQRYNYTIVSDPGVGIHPGRQIYLERISYTGTLNEEGPYSVDFIRDRQLEESKRKDVRIDCRYGYKMVTADLLRTIVVNLNNEIIRSYDLKYREGAFFKTLLESITELDDQGDIFYAHSFEYFDDVNASAGYAPLKSEVDWTIGDDNITGGIINPIPGFTGQSSALNTQTSSSIGGGLAITAGFIGDGWSKQFTVGGSFEFDNTTTEGMVSMIDIDGDNLPDKVVKKGSKIFFRRNIKGVKSFGGLTSIPGIQDFNASTAQTFSGGLQIIPVGPVFFGYNYGNTTANTTTYFADYNGDRLIDVAANGQVQFNHIDQSGNPFFENNSTRTPNPLFFGGTIDKTFLAPDTALQRRQEMEFPLQDIIRFWTAPFDGKINITAPVQLIQVADSLRSAKEDGVRVSIQLRDAIIWDARISSGDFSTRTPSGITGLEIKKDDRIYFRVQSIYNGENDEVNWDPIIQYTSSVSPSIDVNNKNTSYYRASEDFVISGSQPLGIGSTGKIRIFGSFNKSITSDTIVLQVTRLDTQGTIATIFRREFPGNTTFSGALEEIQENVQAGDLLNFQVLSDSYIDRTAVQWFPKYETSFFDASGQNEMKQGGVIVPENNNYNNWLRTTPVITSSETDTMTVDPLIFTKADSSGTLIFTLKGLDTIYGKRQIQIRNGNVISNAHSIPLILQAGKPLYPEFHADDENLALSIQSASIITSQEIVVLERDTSIQDSIVTKPVRTISRDTLGAGFYTNSNMDRATAIFRGWGQFSFVGGKGDGPLDEEALNFMEVQEMEFDNIFADTARYREDPDALRNVQNPAKSDFVCLYGNGQKGQWVGRDTAVYVSATRMSSSRLFMHDVSVDSLMLSSGASLSAVNKIEKSEVNSVAAGAILSAGFSDASTTSMLDVMDLNGDEYPDIIHIDDVQFTLPNGGLEAQGRLNAIGVANSDATSFGISLGGKFPKASASNRNNSGRTNANNRQTKTNARNEHNTANTSIGVTGSLSINGNDESTNSSWLDMNGDGLPDKVYKNGTVSLNLGYSFTALENWNFQDIDKSSSTSLGAGIGVNILSGTIEGGFGLSRTTSGVSSMILDITGDGLPDKLSTSENLKVEINTGTGFQPSIDWKEAKEISSTLSTGESINVAFTIPINIYIILLKICINPSFHLGQGVSSQMDQIMDIDGDGYPDVIHSSDDGNLSVRSSTIGRTNMVRKVNCPLGAHFTMDYEQIGLTYDMPQTVWALSSTEFFDGVVGDGVDTMRNRFRYEGGYYDRHEREFYGFEKVITENLNTAANDSLYRYGEEIFLNKNYYGKGLLIKQTLKDKQDRIFNQTIHTYENRIVADSVVFPALIQTDDLKYEGEAVAGASTYTTYDYDLLGNMIKIIDVGNGTPEDRLEANIAYHNIESSYIKGIPSELQVLTIEGVKRRRTAEIDDKGHITKIMQFLGDGSSADYDLDYDSYGNLSKITRPSNYKNERLSYSYEYDDIIKSYVIKTSDSYGYSDSTVYEYRFGETLGTKSIQGEKIEYKIDNRGRLSSVIGPYELESGKDYTIAYEYFPDADVPYGITHHYDPEFDDDIDFITFIDGLGRTIEYKKLGSLYQGQDSADELKMIISGKTIYDAFGRVTAKYFPTTESLGASNSTLSSEFGNIKESLFYDVENRQTKSVLADGSTTKTNYRALDNFIITLSADGNGNEVERFMDVRNRKVLTKQYGGPNGTIITRYYYNAINELIRVEDHDQNNIITAYDNLGRKISVDHPDAGHTYLQYDLANNLIQKVTPEIRKSIPDGGAIRYEYDLERITGIDYPIHYQNKVSYAYGPPESGNRTGRIILQQDASGGREFYYGKLGEIIKEIRTVLVNSVFFTTYVSEQEYDTWNRIKKMTYPDGEQVMYNYNKAGKLLTITGSKLGNQYNYVQKVGYDEYEDKVYLKYGNGTEMHYAYDPLRRRLNLLRATTLDGRLLMDNEYAYDPVSNIISIENRSIPVQNLLGGRTSHKYTFDNLYRLSAANGLFEGGQDTAAYKLEMDYDNLFNIESKKLVMDDPKESYEHVYLYGNAGPHQPQLIGEVEQHYDLNGNLAISGNKEYYWDEEDRLMAVLDSGFVSEYTYDAVGERIIKSSGGMQGTWLNGARAGTINHNDNYTIYVSPYLVTRQHGFTKHIFMGSERIITKIGTGNFTNISFPEPALTAGGIDYIKRAKQLKADRINYYASLGVSPGPPTNKLFYAEPQNSGIAAPVLVDSTAASVPQGWPGNITPPINGPPTYVMPIPSNEEVEAGYGYKGTGHFFEANQYFYHKDHLGSTSYISDLSGEATEHIVYTPFGEILHSTHKNSYTTPYLFNAKERDQETGLYYYGARYYDPNSSIWLSVDPMWDHPKEIDKSHYAYVSNNPIIYVDPDGRAKREKKPVKRFDPSFPKRTIRKTNFTKEKMRLLKLAAKHGWSTIKLNKKVGAAYEKQVKQDLIKEGYDVVEQVQISFGGTKRKGYLDLVAKKPKSSDIHVYEAKSSPTAGFTPGQKVYKKLILTTGVTVDSGKLQKWGVKKGQKNWKAKSFRIRRAKY